MTAITLRDADATAALGRGLAGRIRPGDIVTLEGPLGSGKTTLVRGLLEELGLEEDAPSPSFAIVIAYVPPEVRLSLWHADLYRIESPEEIGELGLDDLAEAALVVEWPERAGRGAWPDALALTLAVMPDGSRRLTWTAGASWAGRWPPDP